MTQYMTWGKHPKYAQGQWIKLYSGSNKREAAGRRKEGFELCTVPVGIHPNKTRQTTSPYPANSGFGLRVHHAEKAIRKLGDDTWANIYTRGFDNCFENGDGDAVVWALIHKAVQEPDDFNKSQLTRGIQAMFSSTLDGQKYPKKWLDVYYGVEIEKNAQLSLF